MYIIIVTNVSVVVLEYVEVSRRTLAGNTGLAVALTLSGVYQVPALYCTVLYCTVYCTVLHQPWLARWLGHWASFNWTVFSLFGLTLAVPFLLPESCRWLIANDKKDKVQGASDE